MEIKELTELIDAVVSLAEEVEKDSEDGKLTIIEILGNYPQILAVIEEGKDYDAIVDEIVDLDEAEILVISQKLIGLVFTIIKTVKNLK